MKIEKARPFGQCGDSTVDAGIPIYVNTDANPRKSSKQHLPPNPDRNPEITENICAGNSQPI